MSRHYAVRVRSLILTIITLSVLATAQDTRTLGRKGCPVEFTVPADWSGTSSSRCTYELTNGDKTIEMSLYSGSIGDAEMLYWNANDFDDKVADVTLGPYKAKHREDPRLYVASNGELLVFATTKDDAPADVMEKLLSTMVFTGTTVHGSSARHPILFARDCGVTVDYPPDLIAKPGPRRCSVELYSAWPPPVDGPVTIQASDEGFPSDYCISAPVPGEIATEVKTIKRPEWILFQESGSERGFGNTGYQGYRDWETWIFSDRCDRTVVVSSPSEELGKTLMKTMKFVPAKCEHPLNSVPHCNE